MPARNRNPADCPGPVSGCGARGEWPRSGRDVDPDLAGGVVGEGPCGRMSAPRRAGRPPPIKLADRGVELAQVAQRQGAGDAVVGLWNTVSPAWRARAIARIGSRGGERPPVLAAERVGAAQRVPCEPRGRRILVPAGATPSSASALARDRLPRRHAPRAAVATAPGRPSATRGTVDGLVGPGEISGGPGNRRTRTRGQERVAPRGRGQAPTEGGAQVGQLGVGRRGPANLVGTAHLTVGARHPRHRPGRMGLLSRRARRPRETAVRTVAAVPASRTAYRTGRRGGHERVLDQRGQRGVGVVGVRSSTAATASVVQPPANTDRARNASRSSSSRS